MGSPRTFYSDTYVDYPNNSSRNVHRVDDAKEFMGYIFVLHDVTGSNSLRDVRILQLVDGGPNVVNGGKFLSNTRAFTTSLDEIGAALVPTAFHRTTARGTKITLYRLIVVATAISYPALHHDEALHPRHRAGNLTVDTSFGTSGNGLVDLVAPNSMCNAGQRHLC